MSSFSINHLSRGFKNFVRKCPKYHYVCEIVVSFWFYHSFYIPSIKVLLQIYPYQLGLFLAAWSTVSKWKATYVVHSFNCPLIFKYSFNFLIFRVVELIALIVLSVVTNEFFCLFKSLVSLKIHGFWKLNRFQLTTNIILFEGQILTILVSGKPTQVGSFRHDKKTSLISGKTCLRFPLYLPFPKSRDSHLTLAPWFLLVGGWY